MKPNVDFADQTGEVEKLKNARKRTRGEEKSEVKKEEAPAVQNDFIGNELKKFNLSDAVIAEWKKDFLPLTVTDVNDKEGLTKVAEAWRTVRNTRIDVEKKGKELRADAVAFQKAVIGEEKRLVEQLSEIESHLEKQKNFVEEEKKRIREEREKQMQLRVQSRTAELVKLGYAFNGDSYELPTDEGVVKVSTMEVKMLEEQPFNIFILKGQIQHEKERIRLEEQEKIRKAEEERLAAIRAEQEKEAARLEEIRKEQERVAAELKAQQDKLEADKRAAEEAKKRAEELEKAKAEAAEKALRDAELKRMAELTAKAKADADALAKKEAEEKERIRQEALRPDAEKLVTFGEKFAQVIEGVEFPEMSTEPGKTAIQQFKDQITKFALWTRRQKLQ